MSKKTVVVIVALSIIAGLFVGCKADMIDTLRKVQAEVEISVKLPDELRTADYNPDDDFDFTLELYPTDDSSPKIVEPFSYAENLVLVFRFDPGEYTFEIFGKDKSTGVLKAHGKSTITLQPGQREELEIPMTYYIYGDGSGFTVEDGVITLSGKLEFTDDKIITVPDGMKVVIAKDAEISVGAGNTLKIDGVVEAQGDLTIGGNLEVTEDFSVAGDITFSENTILTLDDGKHLAVGGSISAKKNFTVTGDGNLTAEDALTVANDFISEKDSTVVVETLAVAGATEVKGQVSAHHLAEKEGADTLSITIDDGGSLSVTTIASEYENVTIDGGGAMTIVDGATLKEVTLNDQSTLNIGGALHGSESAGLTLKGDGALSAGSVDSSKFTTEGDQSITADTFDIDEIVLEIGKNLTLSGDVTTSKVTGGGKVSVDGTITVDDLTIEAGSSFEASSLEAQNENITIQGGGSVLVHSDVSVGDVTLDGATLTIEGVLESDTLTGAGTLTADSVVTGPLSNSGDFTITADSVKADSIELKDSASLSVDGSVTVGSIAGDGNLDVSLIVGSEGDLLISGKPTITGNLTLEPDTTLSFVDDAELTVTGDIKAWGDLELSGKGKLNAENVTVQGNLDYDASETPIDVGSGAIKVNTLPVGDKPHLEIFVKAGERFPIEELEAGWKTITVTGGGTLCIESVDSNVDVTAIIIAGGSSLEFSDDVALKFADDAKITIGSGSELTIGSDVVAQGALTVTGSGAVTIAGDLSVAGEAEIDSDVTVGSITIGVQDPTVTIAENGSLTVLSEGTTEIPTIELSDGGAVTIAGSLESTVIGGSGRVTADQIAAETLKTDASKPLILDSNDVTVEKVIGDGTAKVEGTLTAKGLSIADSARLEVDTLTVEAGDTLAITDGGTLVVNSNTTVGDVELKDGSTVEVLGNLTIDTDSTITFAGDASLDVIGDIAASGDLTLEGSGELNADSNLSVEGDFKTAVAVGIEDTLTVGGSAEIDDAVTVGSLTIGSKETVAITANGSLEIKDEGTTALGTATVAEGGSLKVEGTLAADTIGGGGSITADSVAVDTLDTTKEKTLTLTGDVSVAKVTGEGTAQVVGVAKVDTLEIEEKATLVATGLEVQSDTLELSGEGTLKVESDLAVEQVIINDGSTLEVAGTVSSTTISGSGTVKADDVVTDSIKNSGALTVVADSITVTEVEFIADETLTLTGDVTTESISGDGTLSVEGDLILKEDSSIAGSLAVTGELSAEGDLSIEKDLTVGGDLAVTGALEVKGTTTVTGDTTTSKLVVTTDTTIDSNLTVTDELGIHDGATLTVKDSSLTINEDGTLEIDGGALKVEKDGAVTIEEGSLAIQNGGTLEVDEGTLTVEKDGTITIEDGSLSIDNSGTLIVDEGVLEVEKGGTITVEDGSLAIQNGGTLTVDEGTLEVEKDGTITVEDGSLAIKNDGTLEVDHGVLEVEKDGSVTVEDGSLLIDNGGTLSIDEGELDVQETGSLTVKNGIITVDNSGTLEVDKGALEVEKDGTITVENGSLAIKNEGTLTVDEGTLEVEKDGTVTVENGSLILDNGSTLSIDEGELDVQENGSLTVKDGTITVDNSGTLEVDKGALEIEKDGAITVEDGSLTIKNDGTLTVDEGTLKVEKDGAVTVEDGSLAIKNDGTLEVDKGVLEVEKDGVVTIEDGSLIIDNGGTLSIDEGELDVQENGNLTVKDGTITVDASGTFEVDKGVLEVEKDGVVTIEDGSLILDNGGTLSIDEGELDVQENGSLTVKDGTITVDANGTLAVDHGVLEIEKDGTVTVKNGSLVIKNEGTLTVDEGTLEVEKDGRVTVEDGSLIIDSGSSLSIDEGKLDVQEDGTLSVKDGTITIDASGTLEVDKGTLEVEKDGTILVENGSLAVKNGGTLTVDEGTIEVEKDGNLTVESNSTLAIDGGFVEINDGKLEVKENGTLILEDGKIAMQGAAADATINGTVIIDGDSALDLGPTNLNGTIGNKGKIILSSPDAKVTENDADIRWYVLGDEANAEYTKPDDVNLGFTADDEAISTVTIREVKTVEPSELVKVNEGITFIIEDEKGLKTNAPNRFIVEGEAVLESGSSLDIKDEWLKWGTGTDGQVTAQAGSTVKFNDTEYIGSADPQWSLGEGSEAIFSRDTKKAIEFTSETDSAISTDKITHLNATNDSVTLSGQVKWTLTEDITLTGEPLLITDQAGLIVPEGTTFKKPLWLADIVEEDGYVEIIGGKAYMGGTTPAATRYWFGPPLATPNNDPLTNPFYALQSNVKVRFSVDGYAFTRIDENVQDNISVATMDISGHETRFVDPLHFYEGVTLEVKRIFIPSLLNIHADAKLVIDKNGVLAIATDKTATLHEGAKLDIHGKIGPYTYVGATHSNGKLLIKSGAIVTISENGTLETKDLDVSGEVIISDGTLNLNGGWNVVDFGDEGKIVVTQDSGKLLQGTTNLKWYTLTEAKAVYSKDNGSRKLEFETNGATPTVKPRAVNLGPAETTTYVGADVTLSIDRTGFRVANGRQLIVSDEGILDVGVYWFGNLSNADFKGEIVVMEKGRMYWDETNRLTVGPSTITTGWHKWAWKQNGTKTIITSPGNWTFSAVKIADDNSIDIRHDGVVTPINIGSGVYAEITGELNQTNNTFTNNGVVTVTGELGISGKGKFINNGIVNGKANITGYDNATFWQGAAPID